MIDKESPPTLRRVGRRLYITHTHAAIVEELGLESALESADYSFESADSNAYSPKIGVWVRASTLTVLEIVHVYTSIGSGLIYQL